MQEKPTTKNSKTNLIVLSIIVLLLFLGLIFFSKQRPCIGLDCLSFQGKNNFKTQEIYQSDENSFRGMFINGNDRLRIDVKSDIKQENASEEITIMITKMKKLFEKERSPYPGEISDVVACDDKFIPKWNSKNVSGLEVNYTTAFLNDRMVYGACTENQLTYKSLFMTFYCPSQQKLYQLEIISDKNTFLDKLNKYMEMLDSLVCR